MTEEEWLTAAGMAGMDAVVAWLFAREQNHRKLRLFSCACCRVMERWMKNERMKQALDRAEQFADGRFSEGTMNRWRLEAQKVGWAARGAADGLCPEWFAYHGVESVCDPRRNHLHTLVARTLLFAHESFGPEFVATAPALAFHLLRDVFGNPFRKVKFDKAWRTDTAVLLAQQMYNSRDFSAMPILADALQDAGCDSEEVLNHCRDANTPHVRGWWVVDLVLGKE